MMTSGRYEELKQGDILSRDDRDNIMLVAPHLDDGWYVADVDENGDKMGDDYLLTMREVKTFN